VVNVLASAAHYTDNVLRWAAYPEPTWLSPPRTDAFWFIMTPAAIAAYTGWRVGWRAWPSASYAYAAMSLLVLGHYLYAPPWRMSAACNASVIVETVAALWLVVVTRALAQRPDVRGKGCAGEATSAAVDHQRPT
jgi:hypothetical protein